MALRGWCGECAGYVTLTDEGLCPNGHLRPSLRGVVEVPDAAGAGPAGVPQPAHLVAATEVPVTDAVYPFDIKIPVVLGLMTVTWIASSLVFRVPVSITVAGLWAWFAFRTATKAYAATDSDGLEFVANGLWRRKIEWRSIVTGRREGDKVRLEVFQGQPAVLTLKSVRTNRREQLPTELAHRLGARWAPCATETELSAASRAARMRTLLPLVLLLLVVLFLFYVLRIRHPEWIQQFPL